MSESIVKDDPDTDLVESEPHTRTVYQFVHLRMNEHVTSECDEIVAHLERDPEVRRLCERVGRVDAVRYALGVAVKHLRARAAEKSEPV